MVIDSRSQNIYVTGRFVDVRTIAHHADHENIIPAVPIGHGDDSTLVGGRNDFFSYNIERNEWHQISSCTAVSSGPRLLFDHAMCIDEESAVIYVFGGNIVQFRRTIDGFQVKTGRLSGLYAYHIKSNKWQCLQRDASDVLNTRVAPVTPSSSAAVESSTTVADTAMSEATPTTSSAAAGSASATDTNSNSSQQHLILHVVEPTGGSSVTSITASESSLVVGGPASGAVEQPAASSNNNSYGVTLNFAQQMLANAVAMADQEEEQQAAMLIADYDDEEDEAESLQDDAAQHLLFNHHADGDGDDDDDDDDDGEEDDGEEDDNSTVKDDDDDAEEDEDNDSDVPPPLSPLDPEPASPVGPDTASASQNSNNSRSNASTSTHVLSKHSIPLRVGHCMLFHPKRRVLYIFGGRHGAYDLNDFITYDPARHECTSWAHSSSAPTSSSVRGSGLMQRAVIDAERDEIYVHFGLGRDTATHICIANAATNSGTNTASSANHNSSVVLPLAQHRLYSAQMLDVFPSYRAAPRRQQNSNNESSGKIGESSQHFTQSACAPQKQRAQINMNNSLWVYKISTSEWSCFFSADAKRCSDGSEPCARYAHQILYDTSTRCLFMFGGNPSYSEQRSKRLNDLWRTSLASYSREDVVRKCIFRIRVVEYLSLLQRVRQQQQHQTDLLSTSVDDIFCTTFDLLNYLQTKLAPCITHISIMPESGGKKLGRSGADFDADDDDDSDDRHKLHALAVMLFNANHRPLDKLLDENVDGDRSERLKVFQYISTFVDENRTEPRVDLRDSVRLQI